MTEIAIFMLVSCAPTISLISWKCKLQLNTFFSVFEGLEMMWYLPILTAVILRHSSKLHACLSKITKKLQNSRLIIEVVLNTWNF